MLNEKQQLAEIERLTAELDLHVKGEALGWQEAKRFEARIEKLETTLDKLARLGNEPHLGNSVGNMIARRALEKDTCRHGETGECYACAVVALEDIPNSV